jgi:hypothetical protein
MVGGVVCTILRDWSSAAVRSSARPDQPRSGRVYVIGSGEDFENGRRTTRGNGIQEMLDSGRLEVLYRGRDHRTLVWRLRG